MTYADLWREAINETYGYDDGDDYATVWDIPDGDVLRILTKAADCLRGGATHSFNGEELDVVRHMMPAHEVHQSGARRWVLELADCIGVDVIQESDPDEEAV